MIKESCNLIAQETILVTHLEVYVVHEKIFFSPEPCYLIGQENILVYNSKVRKNALVYLKINKYFILNYLLVAHSHKTNRKDPW